MDKGKKSIKGSHLPGSALGKRKSRSSKPLTHRPGGSAINTAPAAVSQKSKRARTAPVEISMREEVSLVNVQTAFANSAALINPANADLFPWLSTIAEEFTSYYFKKLLFTYEPSAPTTLGGTIALAVNANSDAPLFDSVKQCLNHEGSATCAPWEPITVNALTASNQSKEPFKQIADTTGIESILEGLFNVASGVIQVVTAVASILVDGQVATVDPTPCGKLFVDYTVVLMDPTDHTLADDGVDFYQIPPTAVANINPLPLTCTAFPGSQDINPLRTVMSGDLDASPFILTFAEAGQYTVEWQIETTGAPAISDWESADVVSIGLLGDAQASADSAAGLVFGTDPVEPFYGNVTDSDVPRSNIATLQCVVRINNPDTDKLQFNFSTVDGFTYGGTGSITGTSSGFLIVTQINDENVSGRAHTLEHLASCPDLRASSGVLSLHHSVRRSKAAEILKVSQTDSERFRKAELAKKAQPSKANGVEIDIKLKSLDLKDVKSDYIVVSQSATPSSTVLPAVLKAVSVGPSTVLKVAAPVTTAVRPVKPGG